MALERLERIEAAWVELTRFPDDGKHADGMRRELHTLKGDARVVGFGEVASLCHKLEDLIFFAHGRSYQVPENFDLVVTMALRFIAILVQQKDGATPGGIDLAGFRQQIDEVLRDAQGAETLPPTVPRQGTLSSGISIDRLSQPTLHQFAEAATEVYLEHLNATGRSRARLREVWLGLRDVISALQTVALTPDLARCANSARTLARDLKKDVDLVLDLADVQMPPQAAEALGTALLHVLRNAVDHGLEEPEVRRLAGKRPEGTLQVRARQLAEVVDVSVEDDGTGVDIPSCARAHYYLGVVHNDEGDFDRATDELQRAISSTSGSTRRSRCCGWCAGAWRRRAGAACSRASKE